MPELMGRFFCLKVVILLCLTVFLDAYIFSRTTDVVRLHISRCILR